MSAGRTSRTPRSVLKTPRVYAQAADDSVAGTEEVRKGLEAGGYAAADAAARGSDDDALERGGAGRHAPRARGMIVPSLGGVSVDRSAVMAEGEAAGGGGGSDGGQDAGGGPLDWLTKSNAATGKSPIKIFEQWQNETLELREEVARMEGLLEETSVQRQLDTRFHQATLDKERSSWVREHEDLMQRYSDALATMKAERDALRGQLEGEKGQRQTDAAAWKKMLALVELETKKQVP